MYLFRPVSAVGCSVVRYGVTHTGAGLPDLASGSALLDFGLGGVTVNCVGPESGVKKWSPVF